MLSSFLTYFPNAFVGVVGLKRDEKTAIAHQYYCNIPPISDDMNIMIIDPMLATGGTSIATIQLLRDHGARDKQIYFVCMISAPEGIKAITQAAQDVTIITAITDEQLNDKKFIMPGLGDFGDRYFGTEKMMSNQHNKFMERAIELSLENVQNKRGGPFGAVIVKNDEIIAEGANCVTAQQRSDSSCRNGRDSQCMQQIK